MWRQRIGDRSDAFKNPMQQHAEHSRGHFAGSFVNRHNAAGVKRRIPVLVVTGEDLELGMHDREIARIGIEFDFPVQGHLLTRHEHVRQVGSMKPLGIEQRVRSVGKRCLKQAQFAALESGEFGRLDLGQYRGHLTRCKSTNGLNVAAVLIAKGRVGEQVLDDFQPLGL